MIFIATTRLIVKHPPNFLGTKLGASFLVGNYSKLFFFGSDRSPRRGVNITAFGADHHLQECLSLPSDLQSADHRLYVNGTFLNFSAPPSSVIFLKVVIRAY